MQTFEGYCKNYKIQYKESDTKITSWKPEKQMQEIIGNSDWVCSSCHKRMFQTSVQTRKSDEAAKNFYHCVNKDCPLYNVNQKPIERFTGTGES